MEVYNSMNRSFLFLNKLSGASTACLGLHILTNFPTTGTYFKVLTSTFEKSEDSLFHGDSVSVAIFRRSQDKEMSFSNSSHFICFIHCIFRSLVIKSACK